MFLVEAIRDYARLKKQRKNRNDQVEIRPIRQPQWGPKGALNKTTLATQALLDGEAEALTRKALELAKTGNPMALRLCLERGLPPRKDRPINFTIPKVERAQDLPKVLGAILEAVAQGEITPGERS
jgi:hypothetical protein